jgi:hypothetical protein
MKHDPSAVGALAAAAVWVAAAPLGAQRVARDRRAQAE